MTRALPRELASCTYKVVGVVESLRSPSHGCFFLFWVLWTRISWGPESVLRFMCEFLLAPEYQCNALVSARPFVPCSAHLV